MTVMLHEWKGNVGSDGCTNLRASDHLTGAPSIKGWDSELGKWTWGRIS